MSRYFRRRKFCRFTADGVDKIDYKDIATLKTTLPKTARLSLAVSPVPRRVTSVSSPRPLSALVSWRCCRTPTHTKVEVLNNGNYLT